MTKRRMRPQAIEWARSLPWSAETIDRWLEDVESPRVQRLYPGAMLTYPMLESIVLTGQNPVVIAEMMWHFGWRRLGY